MTNCTWPWLIALLPFVAHLGFDPEEKGIRKIGRLQYLGHRLFSIFEPALLRWIDAVLSNPLFTRTRPGRRALQVIRRLSWAVPHGIVVTTEAAERIIDFIDRNQGPEGARFAVGPCVCQTSLRKYREPVIKDIFLLYAADIFMGLQRGFELVSAEEVKGMLRRFRELGLVHELDFCMQSGRWTFCICNCEPDICVLTRVHLHAGGFLQAGPETVAFDPARCVGLARCGRCLDRCIFGANELIGGRIVLDPGRCLGCGLCVTTCAGGARRMVRREDYAGQATVPAEILLGGEETKASIEEPGDEKHEKAKRR